MLLFRETFDLGVVAASAGEIAGRWAALNGESRLFEDCRPAHFITPPEGAGDAPAHSDEAAPMISSHRVAHLAVVRDAGRITDHRQRQGRGGDGALREMVQLQCAFKINGSATMNSDSPTRLPRRCRPVRRQAAGADRDADRGPRQCLQLRRSRRCDGFQRGPVAPPEDATRPRGLRDRLTKLRDMIDAGEGLYTAFLKRRLSSKWSQTLSSMRAWIGSCRHAATPQDAQATGLLEAVS